MAFILISVCISATIEIRIILALWFPTSSVNTVEGDIMDILPPGAPTPSSLGSIIPPQGCVEDIWAQTRQPDTGCVRRSCQHTLWHLQVRQLLATMRGAIWCQNGFWKTSKQDTSSAREKQNQGSRGSSALTMSRGAALVTSPSLAQKLCWAHPRSLLP